MQPQDFISTIAQAAQEFQIQSNVFASVTIAQAALETGWCNFLPVDKYTGKQSYNLFGVQGNGPNGHVLCDTQEYYNDRLATVEVQFAAYDNFFESIAGHAQVLLRDNFAPVREAATPEEACRQLYRCHYATDPGYADKLIAIIDEFGLKQYDFSRGDLQMIAEMQQQMITLQNQVRALQEQLNAYNDPTVSVWAAAAIKKAEAKKTIVGDTAGHINPKAPVTREQLAVILDRLGLLGK
ncbi:glucosaminidase domain-containing protein [Fodinisporobacter ferrooxydans]|uniref:Glucosaminidase domain-containing protein n=1 Tax=Fodinisporobacter ferrooxydans TaxID=2901836 RepID=A0ABY4CFS4_9BACL|nr:glucosaminidase domain-containing protein [Alicyclobacillaceae bacterium MYW30-H2]